MHGHIEPLLRHVLSHPPARIAARDAGDWWRLTAPIRAAWPEPFDQAAASAFAADRIGYAFASGYQAALGRLVPELPLDAVASLSATEEAGNHPRAIRTELRLLSDGRSTLTGRKRWSTMAPLADVLLVVATTGTDVSGRPRLRVAWVDAGQAGVRVETMAPAPFVPEIPHGEVELREVALPARALLEGDGYAAYLKPFRTIEDLFVHGALLAYVLGAARRYEWGEALVERLAATLVAARGLAAADPAAPEVHVAVAGFLEQSRCLLDETAACWNDAEPAERERWLRDQGLVAVAGRAREARRRRAWGILTGEKRRE